MNTDDVQVRRQASDISLVNLLATMKASDSVELKMTVASDEHNATIATLPIDPVEAQPRQIFFFDTPDLRLNQAGVVVRARRIAGGRADTVVKLRPVVPTDLPDELRKSPAFNVEVDVLPGAFGVCSAALKGRLTGEEVRDAVRGDFPIRKLFTKDQRAFYREHAPEGLEIDALSILGPTFVLKSVFTPPEFGRRIVAELWLYPDGTRILELSTKCLPNEAFQVAAESRAYLAQHGIAVDQAEQQTKTKTALEFFSNHLRHTADGSPGSGFFAALGGEDDAHADTDAPDLDDDDADAEA
ncbi:MAG TPA: hypothetical protein VGM28_03700 [Candidatus Limnocylindrales bacterium]|jgi:hypothetical protein